MQAAARVGLLVIVFVALLYGAYAVLGRAIFAKKTNPYYADFADAGGVAKGAKVLMAGVEVGTVEDVRLLGPRHARLKLAVDNEVRVPQGSTASLSSQMFSLGESPLEILPPRAPTGAVLPPGSVLPGHRAGPLEALLPEGRETVRELNRTLVATRKILEDQEIQRDLKRLLRSTDQTLQQFSGLATQSQGLLAENRAAIRQAVSDASLAMREVRQGAEMLTRILEERKLENQSLALLRRLNAASEKAESLIVNLNQFVTDPAVREPLKQTLSNTAEITERGKAIAANVEQASAKAVELADEAKTIATEVKSALKDVRGFFGRGNRPRSLNISAGMDVLHETDPSHWRTDIDISMPIPGGRAYLGMWDAFESNKLIAQVGREGGGPFSYRYGIYAAKPGVGVDYRPTDKLLLRGDFFDINDPRFDLRMRFELGQGLYGWLGLTRVFDKNAPTFGIGVRR